jgi:hypothetical protein
MLDYLISLLDFTINGTTYNLITSPWLFMLNWIESYKQYANNAAYSTAVRDAYEVLGKLGFMYACLVIVLIILCAWFVYKVASGFTGWFRFR